MAIPPTQRPTYPDVPQAPGVPPVRRIAQIQNTIAQATSDALRIANLFLGPQWGLFTRFGAPLVPSLPVVGSLVGASTSVVDMELRQEKRVSNFPQEQGAFASYNKVSTPFEGRITYAASGFIANRTAMLLAIERAEASLDLYSLVMPERTFPSVNVIHHDFRRSQRKGNTLLFVDVWVEEIRVTGTAAFTNTATPSGANAQALGTMTPLQVSPNSLPVGAPT